MLCSHTIEHVEDPEAFFAELSRVGKNVTLVVPGCSVQNPLEHKWIFLSLRKEHQQLPRHIKLPFA